MLVLACSKQALDRDRLPEDLTAEALIVISDILRDDAKQTLAYFKSKVCVVKSSPEMIL